MEESSPQKLAPQVVRLWRLNGCFLLFIVFFGYVGGAWLISSQIPLLLLVLLGGLLLILLIAGLLYVPKYQYACWHYIVRDDEIELRHGVWFTKRSVIPIVKIQHVDTVQGPLMRAYGVTALILATSAGMHTIPGILPHVADALRQTILTIAKVDDDDQP